MRRTIYSACILALGAIAASSAQAKFVAIFEQVGSAVEEVGGGTIDLTDLTDSPAINPSGLRSRRSHLFSSPEPPEPPERSDNFIAA
jgi:hypothetical protein